MTIGTIEATPEEHPSRVDRRRPSPLTVGGIAALVVLAVFALSAVVVAAANAYYFTGYAADGPYQLYNPLRRLARGQIPGEDVPFFHGVGVLVLHFPLFLVLGGDLFASELTRWLVSPALFLLATSAVAQAVFRDWRRTAIAVVVVTAATLPMDRMVDPSNSLLGVRTTLPVLAAAAILWRLDRPVLLRGRRLDVPFIAASALSGAAVLFGTEQGAAAGLALVVVLTVRALRRRSLLGLVHDLLVYGGTAGLTVLGLATLLTLGHPQAALGYALGDVGVDQGWVFGAPPNVPPTLSSIAWELRGGATFTPSNPVPMYWIGWLCAAVLTLIGIRGGRLPRRWAAGFLFLTVYGLAVLASIIGYVNFIDQLAPLARIACLTIGVALTALVTARSSASGGREPRRLQQWLPVAAALVCAALVVNGGVVRARSMSSAPIQEAATRIAEGHGRSDDAILADGPDEITPWRESEDAFSPYLDVPGTTFWSTYTTVYDSIRGNLNPVEGGEDYIIHALGPERRAQYQRDFLAAAPDYVITMEPAYFIYEEWLWSRWPIFYEELFSGYRIVERNRSHVLWERVPDGQRLFFTPSDAEIDASDGGSIVLPPNPGTTTRLDRITVRYDASTGFTPLERIPRYLLLAEGTGLTYPVSLPWYESSWTFLVPVLPGQEAPRLRPIAQGVIPGAGLVVTGVEAATATTTPPSSAFYEYDSCIASFSADAERCARLPEIAEEMVR